MINVEEKGRGVSAEKDFKKGEVICEYPGELISHSEGIRKETELEADDLCYLFFFNHGSKKWW